MDFVGDVFVVDLVRSSWGVEESRKVPARRESSVSIVCMADS